ncbi:MAG: hypothetical protein JWP05_1388, partial [Microbacteriaceae bacterium]|nr:hypothetical protein [Microbacteriaceae bacterium]
MSDDHQNNDKEIFQSGFSRRNFLAVAGAAGVTLSPLLGSAASASAATTNVRSGATTATVPTVGDPVTTPVVNGLHL